MNKINLKDVSVSTWIRTALLILSLVNMILTAAGKSVLPFSDEQVGEAVSVLFTVITSLVAWWKNNSFTVNAQAADKLLTGQAEAEDAGADA